MVNVSVHFAAGMALAALLALPRVRRAWHARAPLSGSMARWLLLSFALGGLAIVPSILRRLGLPDSVCDNPAMNIFLGYPALNRLLSGGTVWGPALLALAFAAQYAVLLLAIDRRRRMNPTP